MSNPQISPREGETPDRGRESPEETYEKLYRRRAAKRKQEHVIDQLEALGSDVPYERARECCMRIDQEADGTITSRYCNSRWCVVCARIRCGHHVRNQLPVIRSWEDPQLVTLTIPNIPWGGGSKAASRLRQTYEEMLDRFNNAKRSCNRTRGLDFRALRNFEVVWNGEREELNTHFHVVVPDQEIAEALIEEWLKRCPQAVRDAQDVRPLGSEEEDLLEVCKYVTKIVGGEEGECAYPPKVLDVIFRAMHSKKLLQSVGYSPADFDGVEDEEIEELEQLERQMCSWKRVGEPVCWHWEPGIGDWVDRETGEVFVGGEPP